MPARFARRPSVTLPTTSRRFGWCRILATGNNVAHLELLAGSATPRTGLLFEPANLALTAAVLAVVMVSHVILQKVPPEMGLF